MVRPLPWPLAYRGLLSLFLLLCGAKMLIVPLHGRYLNDLPALVLIGSSWGFALVVYGGTLGIFWALCGLFGKRWLPKLWLPVPRLLLISTITLILGSWGIWQGIKVPTVREHTIVIPTLPPGLEGTRVAVLSDMHIGGIAGERWAHEVVQRTNAAKPDLIAVLGDVVDGSTDDLAQAVAPLAELTAPRGVFYVPGNHEYYSGFEPWMKHFRGLGLRVLSNEHVVQPGTPEKKGTLVVAGILDPAGRRYAENTRPDITKALAGRPEGPDVFTLLLAHQPIHTAKNSRFGVNLQVSGHTHGGSILPLQPLIAKVNDGFVLGSYQIGKTRLYVTSGAGIWSGVPLRFGVPAEIAVLRLTSGKH